MKRLLLATTAAIVLAAPAFAADLPVAMPTKAPAYVPAWSWTGFYLGANLGGGFAQGTVTDTLAGVGSVSSSENLSGVIGGGQIGYNWQAGQFVFGVEADVDGSGESVTNNLSCGAGCAVTGTDKVQAFGTARGRVGLAFDRWLVYATGGYSWQNLSSTIALTSPFGNASASASTTRGGYVVGGGVETALWGNWIGGVEYLYLDTGNFTTASFGADNETLRVQNSVVRARLSYKF